MSENIIYVGEMEFPDKNAAAHRVVANCRILESIGYQPILIGLNRQMQMNKEQDTKKELHGFTLFEFPYPSSNIQWVRFISRIDYVKQIVENIGADNVYAIIAYNFPSIAMARLMKYCRRIGIHFVSDVTEWYGASRRSFPSNIVKDLDTSIRMQILNKKAKNVLCISSYLDDYYSIRNCNTVVIPSIVDSSNRKWLSEEIYKPNETRSLAYVGSPGGNLDKDRLDWIIEALAEIKEEKGLSLILNVIGVSRQEYSKLFQDQKPVLEFLGSDIRFHGKLNHQKAIEFVKKADYSVFARSSNRVTNAGFPTKLAESFACGTPVITTPTSDISKYLKDGFNGFLSSDCSIEGVENCIEKAIEIDDSSLIEMHKNCLITNPLDMRNFEGVMKAFMDDLA